jgi:hypothetical protein
MSIHSTGLVDDERSKHAGIDPATMLTRRAAAAALNAAGYPVAETTLATKATRGGGPPFCKFGPRALYKWADLITWAEARLSEPRRSTSEADVV